MKTFYISGYWKDNREQFENYIVSESDTFSREDFEDDDVFFYGLSEAEIKEAIELGEDTVHDFVITSYEEI